MSSSLKTFEPILNIPLHFVKQDRLIPNTLMTDEEILNKLMLYSDDGITLPSYKKLKENNLSNLYSIIRQRYGSTINFCEKYNKKTKIKPNGFWNLKRIFDIFDKMIEEKGFILTLDSMDKYYKGLGTACKKLGGSIYCKLSYYEYLLNNNKTISYNDIEYIKQIAKIKKSHIHNYSKDLEIKANFILEKLKKAQ